MKTSKHVRMFSEGHLRAGESVAAWCQGYIGEVMGSGDKAQEHGALIVTGDRVVFYRKGLFGDVQESIPLKGITSIERRSVMGHRTLRLHTSHDELVFKTVDKEAEAACVEAIETGRGMNSAVTGRGTDSGLQARPQRSVVKSDEQKTPEKSLTVQVSGAEGRSVQQDADATGNSGSMPGNAADDVSVSRNIGEPQIEGVQIRQDDDLIV